MVLSGGKSGDYFKGLPIAKAAAQHGASAAAKGL